MLGRHRDRETVRSERRRSLIDLSVPVTAWAATGALMAMVQYRSRIGRDGSGGAMWPGWYSFFAGWGQYDAGEFISIADDGYWYRPDERSPTSFFPLFPLLMRAVRPLTGSTMVAGVLVAAISGLAATVMLWWWLRRVGIGDDARRWTLLIVLLSPWGWFLFGVPFSDALFIALVIAAFLLVERDQLVLAGVVGAFATAARPTGLALVPALVVLGLERTGALRFSERSPSWARRWRVPMHVDRSAITASNIAPAFAIAGVLTYSIYLGVRFGSPFVYITDQRLYNGTGLNTLFKAGLVRGWMTLDDPWRTASQTLGALTAGVALLAAPTVGRRFGWGYAVFVFGLVLMPTIATRDFNSTGRYLLAAFPVAVIVADKLASRPVGRVGWLVVSFGVALAFNAAFARSQMVS